MRDCYIEGKEVIALVPFLMQFNRTQQRSPLILGVLLAL